MAGVAASWRTIESVLWENAHSVYRALRKPATDRQIAHLAKLVPAKLPRDFVQSLKTHDGLRDSYLGQNRLFDYYALMPVSALIAEYKMLCELEALDPIGGSHAGADAAIRNDARFRPGWVPFMDADGDKLVLDLDPAPGGTYGQVFEWSSTGSTRNRVLAPSFGAWLVGLADTLVKRRFGLDKYGGIWLGGVPSAESVPTPDRPRE
ncbi:MAG TPA: SMI1/KNR4 family protein [Gemmataceae bacterium]|jgi:cell wall assembly regulator SMI1